MCIDVNLCVFMNMAVCYVVLMQYLMTPPCIFKQKKTQNAHFSRLHEILTFFKNLGICWNFIGRDGFNVYVGVIDHTLKRNPERRAPNSEKSRHF